MVLVLEGLFIALVGAGGAWGALSIPAAEPGETWSGVVPMGVSVVLALAGLGIAAGGVRVATAGEAALVRPPRAAWEVMGLFVLALAYWQAIPLFGYLLPTAAVAPVALAAFGVRSPIGLLLAAVLCPLVFHLIFFEGLGAFPPRGEVFDLLEAITARE